MEEKMHLLIEKELSSEDKILKPDFNQKTGRELLAFYLQTKFIQIIALDSKAEKSAFIDIKYDFILKGAVNPPPFLNLLLLRRRCIN
jgi:hypothetical protein